MTLSCADTEARMIDLVDRRLDPPTELRLHAHLEGCAECRRKVELWRGLVPDLRALAPAPPAALAARRMEVEVMRQLHAPAAPATVLGRRRWLLAGGGTVLVAAAAMLILWLRAPGAPVAGYATVVRASGSVAGDGRALSSSSVLAPGVRVELAAGAELELAMERGTTLRLRGPARLALTGTPANAELRLDQGVLAAEVAHRMPGETFGVVTRDLRVAVRGTRFEVTAAAGASRVAVEIGLVAVQFNDGHEQLVGSGESVSSEPPPAAIPPTPAEANPPETPSCGLKLRSCQETARAARDSMRADDHQRALRLLAAPTHGTSGQAAPACGRALTACDDELRYLRAEALRGTGRVDETVAAFKELNRPSAPRAMRQNALYAAAELERRQGRAREACADYEGALAVAPGGALREEALIGAMESAEMSAQAPRARGHARRYLAEFPAGRAVATARRLAGAAAAE